MNHRDRVDTQGCQIPSQPLGRDGAPRGQAGSAVLDQAQLTVGPQAVASECGHFQVPESGIRVHTLDSWQDSHSFLELWDKNDDSGKGQGGGPGTASSQANKIKFLKSLT